MKWEWESCLANIGQVESNIKTCALLVLSFNCCQLAIVELSFNCCQLAIVELSFNCCHLAIVELSFNCCHLAIVEFQVLPPCLCWASIVATLLVLSFMGKPVLEIGDCIVCGHLPYFQSASVNSFHPSGAHRLKKKALNWIVGKWKKWDSEFCYSAKGHFHFLIKFFVLRSQVSHLWGHSIQKNKLNCHVTSKKENLELSWRFYTWALSVTSICLNKAVPPHLVISSTTLTTLSIPTWSPLHRCQIVE